MQAILVMFRSTGERRSFSVTRDVTVIGRREDCDLIIPLGEVSRKHCRLVKDGDLLKVEDLGSANGTYLNGQRVQESLLAPGDTVQVGPVVFVLQIDGVPADDELRPVIAESAGGGAAGAGADVRANNPDDDLGELEPIDINGSIGDVELSELEEENAEAAAKSAPPSPKRVPPPVPKGLEPDELDLADPAGHGSDTSGGIPLDDLDPDGGGGSRTKDGSGEELDLLEIEPEHEQQRRG
jgi:pSer/pThr/pTyr-binding forkhead associated (FHA) protein